MTTTIGNNILQENHNSSNGTVQQVRYKHDTSFAYFIPDRLNGPDRYTPDLKYPDNQKSASAKSGDRGVHRNLQPLLMILSSPNVCIKNDSNVVAE